MNTIVCDAIAYFRASQVLTEVDLNKPELDTMDDILFGPNKFGQLACQVCYTILDGSDSDGDHWKSILPDQRQWDDFEKDRLMCDGRWFECQKSKLIAAWIASVHRTTEVLHRSNRGSDDDRLIHASVKISLCVFS